MNKRLLQGYQVEPSEWRKFFEGLVIENFKTQDQIRLGAFSSPSTVSKSASCTTLTLADTHATYSPSSAAT